MLIKEYRIPMPLNIDEYKIAQLYMIQVKINHYFNLILMKLFELEL